VTEPFDASGPIAPAPVADSQPAYVQLTQARVPLDEAADAFGIPDASGRLPIVLLPRAPYRINNTLVIVGLIAAVVGLILDLQLVLRGGLLAAGIILVFLGVFRSFLVRVPEGTQAILLRRGRVDRTIGPGSHVVPPWIAVSHLVTTREIPFDIPVVESPTREGVRVAIDVLLTFRITEPTEFVFAISAPDFDQVCQAAGQDALRTLVRSTSAEAVLDLAGAESGRLAESIGAALSGYGVHVVKVVILQIRLPDEYMRSLEGRRLAVAQREEEVERHALEQRRQADRETLERQRAEAKRQLIELDAANEALRLERLQERLGAYPQAARYDLETARLDVARSLAANSRAMVQVGPGADIASALVMRDLADEAAGGAAPSDPAAGGRKRPTRPTGDA
jgi:regulator of protease activity HflC (stomatin/prohibitin superfamily)